MNAYFACLASPNKRSLHHVLRGPKSSSAQVREKLGAYIFLKYMLSVCDYQWKRAITRVNLILEAKCPTGWRIANFFSFPVILCKPCHSLHLSRSAAIRSADSCTFSIRVSLTRASTPDRCQCCRRRSWRDLQTTGVCAFLFSPSP